MCRNISEFIHFHFWFSEWILATCLWRSWLAQSTSNFFVELLHKGSIQVVEWRSHQHSTQSSLRILGADGRFFFLRGIWLWISLGMPTIQKCTCFLSEPIRSSSCNLRWLSRVFRQTMTTTALRSRRRCANFGSVSSKTIKLIKRFIKYVRACSTTVVVQTVLNDGKMYVKNKNLHPIPESVTTHYFYLNWKTIKTQRCKKV